MEEVFPPAITTPALDPVTVQAIFEINADLDDAKRHAHIEAERRHDAGTKMRALLDKVPYGEKGAFIKAHFTCSQSDAYRCMRLATFPKLGKLTELWREIQAGPAKEDAILCPACAAKGAIQGCSKCAKLREEAGAKEPVEKLQKDSGVDYGEDKDDSTRQPGEDTEDEEEDDEEYEVDEAPGKPVNVDDHGKKKKKKKPVSQAKPAKPKLVLTDRVGKAIPDKCRDAFVDPGLADLIDELEQVEAMFSVDSWTARAGKLTAHYGFILIERIPEHSLEALHRVQSLLESLRAGVPYAVCPRCEGDGMIAGTQCNGCRGYGHVPEHRYLEMQKEAKSETA